MPGARRDDRDAALARRRERRLARPGPVAARPRIEHALDAQPSEHVGGAADVVALGMREDDRATASGCPGARAGRRRPPRAGPRRRARAPRRVSSSDRSPWPTSRNVTRSPVGGGRRARRERAATRASAEQRAPPRRERRAAGADRGSRCSASSATAAVPSSSADAASDADLSDRQRRDDARDELEPRGAASRRASASASGGDGEHRIDDRGRASPSPSSGAIAGAASAFAGTVYSGTPGRSGARRSARSRAPQRGETASASASQPRQRIALERALGARGTATKIAATAANESWKPGSSSDVGRPREQDERAEREEVPAVARSRARARRATRAPPATPARTTDGCQPTASTYAAIARERRQLAREPRDAAAASRARARRARGTRRSGPRRPAGGRGPRRGSRRAARPASPSSSPRTIAEHERAPLAVERRARPRARRGRGAGRRRRRCRRAGRRCRQLAAGRTTWTPLTREPGALVEAVLRAARLGDAHGSSRMAPCGGERPTGSTSSTRSRSRRVAEARAPRPGRANAHGVGAPGR